MPKRGSDADHRIFFDQLVSVGVSRLKASGAIRLEDRQALIPFGQQNKLIAVAHTKFPNGGAWSYLVCPKCGRRAKRLWLVDDAPRCRLCLEMLGVRYRASYCFGRTERLRERDRRVDRLQAMLEGGLMRFKPVPPNWSNRRLDRRNRLTWVLRERGSSLASLKSRTKSKAASQMSRWRSSAPTSHAQPQSRQSQTSDRSGGPNQPKNSNKPSTVPKASYSKHWKARIFKRD